MDIDKDVACKPGECDPRGHLVQWTCPKSGINYPIMHTKQLYIRDAVNGIAMRMDNLEKLLSNLIKK